MEDAGAAALVLHSLFEEHVRHESYQPHHHLMHGTESFAESLAYSPERNALTIGPETYLNEIAAAKEAMRNIALYVNCHKSLIIWCAKRDCSGDVDRARTEMPSAAISSPLN
jgi:dihydroorotate dehydrogenase (fumarate)